MNDFTINQAGLEFHRSIQRETAKMLVQAKIESANYFLAEVIDKVDTLMKEHSLSQDDLIDLGVIKERTCQHVDFLNEAKMKITDL